MYTDPEPGRPGPAGGGGPGMDWQRIKAVLLRGLVMLLFAAGIAISETLLLAIAVVQFLWLLFAGEPNAFVARFGRSLGHWLAAVSAYQAAASEEKPFPWAAWPDPDGPA